MEPGKAPTKGEKGRGERSAGAVHNREQRGQVAEKRRVPTSDCRTSETRTSKHSAHGNHTKHTHENHPLQSKAPCPPMAPVNVSRARGNSHAAASGQEGTVGATGEHATSTRDPHARRVEHIRSMLLPCFVCPPTDARTEEE
jgi:hypothetical protein